MSREEQQDPLHPVEKALGQLDFAHKAGVFRQTHVDFQALFGVAHRAGVKPVYLRNLRLWVPIAAAATLAFGVWGWLFRMELDSIRQSKGRMPSVVQVADGSASKAFSRCLAGPDESIAMGCASYDHDADGDVDLADFGARQLNDIRR